MVRNAIDAIQMGQAGQRLSSMLAGRLFSTICSRTGPLKCSAGSSTTPSLEETFESILLAAAYFGLGIAEGLLKLGMNVYRGWVSENAVRWLRTSIASLSRPQSDGQPGAKATGTEIAMTLSEAEPIGNFVGSSVSEPFLQGGILVSVFAYMVYLQPLMALVAFGVFFPQFLLVPLMQRALNRRVGVRIWTLRKISTGLVDDESRGASTLALQSQRVDRVFDLNMGIYHQVLFELCHESPQHGNGRRPGRCHGHHGRTDIRGRIRCWSCQVNDP
jgi:hypothetical protein